MKRDKLKQLVDENRQDFEIYQGDFDDLWPEIEQGIVSRERSANLKWVWRIAAAVVIGAGLTLMINNLNYASLDADELAYMISPEWAETEQFYAVRINESIEAIKASSVEVDPTVFEDIALLDQAYKELKEDLADGADNEEVINAMITNYQIKLEILEKILFEIRETEAQGNEENYDL